MRFFLLILLFSNSSFALNCDSITDLQVKELIFSQAYKDSLNLGIICNENNVSCSNQDRLTIDEAFQSIKGNSYIKRYSSWVEFSTNKVSDSGYKINSDFENIDCKFQFKLGVALLKPIENENDPLVSSSGISIPLSIKNDKALLHLESWNYLNYDNCRNEKLGYSCFFTNHVAENIRRYLLLKRNEAFKKIISYEDYKNDDFKKNYFKHFSTKHNDENIIFVEINKFNQVVNRVKD